MSTSAADPQWQRSRLGRFHRLSYLYPEDEGLAGLSAVYVLWHGGSRPKWVFVGCSSDLAKSLNEHADDPRMATFDTRGGLFVTWALVREEYQPGVVRYLTDQMKPLIENPNAPRQDVRPIIVRFPGERTAA